MAGFVLNTKYHFSIRMFSNMAVMVEIVSKRVEFSCALSVFVLELFFLSARLLRGICPPDY